MLLISPCLLLLQLLVSVTRRNYMPKYPVLEGNEGWEGGLVRSVNSTLEVIAYRCESSKNQ